MAHGSFARAASQSNCAASSGLPAVMSASLNASSNPARYRDLPAGLPLAPGAHRCGLPGLNIVSLLPDCPGLNLFSLAINSCAPYAVNGACSGSPEINWVRPARQNTGPLTGEPNWNARPLGWTGLKCSLDPGSGQSGKLLSLGAIIATARRKVAAAGCNQLDLPADKVRGERRKASIYLAEPKNANPTNHSISAAPGRL